MRTTSSYLYAQCLLSVELAPAKSSIRLQSSQQAVGKNFRAPDSDINSVDCKVANGKVSGECGGMKTAQVAHSRRRRIRRTRASTGVDFQMLMVVASGLIVWFFRVLENNNYQNVKSMQYLTKAEGTYQEVSVLPYLFCECSQAQLRGSR